MNLEKFRKCNKCGFVLPGGREKCPVCGSKEFVPLEQKIAADNREIKHIEPEKTSVRKPLNEKAPTVGKRRVLKFKKKRKRFKPFFTTAKFDSNFGSMRNNPNDISDAPE